MSKILNFKNLYILLTVVSIYLLFSIVFSDVLKGEEFHLSSGTINTLIVNIVLAIFFGLLFYKNTEKELLNTEIIILLFTSVFFSLLLHIVITRDVIYETGKTFRNPLYSEFTAIADKYNLDLSFTKYVWLERGSIDYKVGTIFNKKHKSIDILFIGDSSISWGLIPTVIEQITEKKVAVYAYESNFLTVKTSKLFSRISQYYLKDNGIVIFAFDNWTQGKAPDAVGISPEECAEIIQWSDKEFSNHAKNNEAGVFKQWLSYSAFKRYYDLKSAYLKTNLSMFLPSPLLYADYIEPLVNPELYEKKSVNKNEKTIFLRWDKDAITLYNPEFKYRSIHSEIMPESPAVSENIRLNSEAASSIYGDKKVYLVPLYYENRSYLASRRTYYSYYQKLGFDLCDLGILQPAKDGYQMHAGSHMGNSGGLMKSILIGEWLKDYLSIDLQ